MANPIRNERGAAALLYVVLISLVLLVATPVILSTVSTDASHGVMNRNTQIAENMAASGLEAFIRYLDKYNETTDGERKQYLSNYGGFTSSPVTFPNPEGVSVTYRFNYNELGAGSNLYSVQSYAEAGVAPYKRTKTISYQIDANMPVTETHYDASNPVPVTQLNQDVLVQGDRLPPSGTSTTPRVDLRTPIHDAIVYYRNTDVPVIPSIPAIPSYSSYVSTLESSSNAVVCSSCTPSAIDSMITNPAHMSKNPLVIRIQSGMSSYDGSNNVQYNWGSPSRPVVLIFDSSVELGGAGTVSLNVTGDIIVKNGNFSMNPGNSSSTVTINKSAGNSYGNLYVSGNVSYSRDAVTNVAGTLQANNLTIRSNVTAGNIYVNNAITNNSGAARSLIASGNIVSGTINMYGTLQAANVYTTGSFMTDNPSTVNVNGGNMVVQSLTVKGTNTSINAGNLYATTDITMENTSSLTIAGVTRSGTITVKGTGSTLTSGSVYTTGQMSIMNASTIKATSGDINVDKFTLSENSTLTARNLIVKQGLEMYNDSRFTLSGNALLGSFTVHTNGAPGITAASGDILVEGDIRAYNNITLVTGGVVAAGGDFNINNGYGTGSNIQTGGGYTSLHLSGSSSSGSSTTTGAWKPKRTG